ncbi:MAG: alpha/beta hydrolase [Desulfobacula sp.]|nr:alpha/beta hydrolase [Desulfobacula sp.]
MESNIRFSSGDFTLEGILNEQSGRDAVVICHPHPLYGGNMDNPVVMTIARAFFEKGFTTLRFNFRGADNSTGKFDEGIGEQDDVKAALSFLDEKGYANRTLAGYSFGARMNASIVSIGCEVKDHIMVSPPVGFMSFDDIENMPSTGLIITGRNDDIAPPALVEKHIKRWKIDSKFKIIEDCDHFYSECLDDLQGVLTDYLL